MWQQPSGVKAMNNLKTISLVTPADPFFCCNNVLCNPFSIDLQHSAGTVSRQFSDHFHTYYSLLLVVVLSSQVDVQWSID